MKAVRLKTEYLQDPLGIDIPHPRLFWTCEDGITQSAFQILAATDGRTVWDSGKVPSGSMPYVAFDSQKKLEGEIARAGFAVLERENLFSTPPNLFVAAKKI